MKYRNKIDIIIENELKHFFKNRELLREDTWVDKQSQKTLDAAHNAYDNNPEARTHMDRIGNHIGVNATPNSPTHSNGTVTMNDGSTQSYEQFLKNMAQRLLNACEQLRGLMKPNGGVDTDVMYAPEIDNFKKDKNPQDVDLENSAELMKCKDLLDLLGLTFLYDTKNASKMIPKEKKFNLIYNAETEVDKDDFFQAVKKAFDLSYATPQDIKKWGGAGTRYGKLSNDDDKFDEKIASGKYRQIGDDWFRIGSYGERFGNKDTWLDANGKPVNDEMYQEIKAAYFKYLVEKTINTVYGLDLEMPGVPFTYGNSKLPSSSLVINFTSAHRCPAWNECLVKYACYARTSEHGYKDLFAKNKRLHLMWEGSRYDAQLQKELFNLIRIHIVNIGKLLGKANAKYRQSNNLKAKAKTPYSAQMFFDTITEGGFGSLPDEVKEILKNDSSTRRVEDIRLNEEGDFVGQWLLDAVDEFASELKEINVKVAAYTCRNLNFDGIRNIIINASTEQIGTHDDKVADAIARRFFAVSEEIYNSMDETYASEIDADGKPVGKPTYPTYVGDENVFGDSKGRIIPYPQPLYLNGQPTGQLYYKCPCGRGKQQSDAKIAKLGVWGPDFNTFSNPNNLERLKQGKKASLEGVNCYDCRMCYTEKLQESDKPVVVLVQVHSANSDLFDTNTSGETKNKRTDHAKIGRSVNYERNRTNLLNGKPKYQQQESKFSNKPLLKESILNPQTSDEALRQIAKNGENSVHAHLTLMKGQMQENAKKQFFDKYKQLFG